MIVHVLIACPHADQVGGEQVLAGLPFGQRKTKTVWVGVDHVVNAWRQEL
jgi:hypothetical protein